MNNIVFFYIALIVSKVVKKVVKLLGKDVFYFHGKVALIICPSFFKYIGVPELIISVSGTNGKTSICKMLVDFFTSSNVEVITNKGFNSVWGIASTFIDNVSINNKVRINTCVLETDELNTKKVYKYITPQYIIISNLCRDFIKYNPHPYYVRDYIRSVIPEGSKLILNADDSIVSSLKRNEDDILYSIDRCKEDHDTLYNKVVDAPLCPVCNSILKYKYVKYNHIGFSYCSKCSYVSQSGKYVVSEVNYEDKYFILNNYKYYLPFDNIYSLYNLVSIISLLLEMGYNNDFINNNTKDLNVVKSRYSSELCNNISIVRMLAKAQTPVSVSGVLNEIRKDNSKKAILFMLDNKNERKSSEIISYLYECDFEFLCDKSIKQIIVTGSRKEDLLLRLLIAKIPKDIIKTVTSEIDAVNILNTTDITKIYIIYDVYMYDDSTKVIDAVKSKLGGN
ncbi:MAG: MurT ligase domain-containing protein [Bacilli bacterium]